MSPNEFATAVVPLVNAIFESHGKPHPSAAVLGLWSVALERYDVNTVIGAIKQHLRRADATYSVLQPNDLILLIDGTPDERAGLAWQKTLAATRSRSPYRSIAFDDLYIHATLLHMGGWIRFAEELNEDNREATRRTFEQAYRLLLKAGLPVDTPPRLAGRSEQEHITMGLPYTEAPQLVGAPAAPQLAQAVPTTIPAQSLPVTGVSHART